MTWMKGLKGSRASGTGRAPSQTAMLLQSVHESHVKSQSFMTLSLTNKAA